MAFQIVLFAAGLLLLIKGGDWFVDSATGIAHKFHLPELLIGATIVSIGTTLPEVMVSVQGALSGSGGVAYGNAIGSIICNTSLIAALSIAVKPAKASRKSLLVPIIFFCLAAAVYCIAAYFTGEFTRVIGFILLGLFVIYMTITFLSVKKPAENAPELNQEASEPERTVSLKDYLVEAVIVAVGGALMLYKGDIIGYIGIATIVAFAVYVIYAVVCFAAKKAFVRIAKDLFFLVVGAGLIAGGANLLVDSGMEIAKEVGVPETVIALTFIALGTSLPELVTTITSLVKGHGSLSLGNIIGANLFNLVLVSGVSIVIAPFEVPADKMIDGMNASLVVDIPVMLAVMGIMVIPALVRQKMSRWQGIALFAVYAAFCAFQFVV